jgi:hypothetical protein
MHLIVITLCLLAQPSAGPADPAPPEKADPVRAEYLADAQKYEFQHDAERKEKLELVEKPVMRWANDDDWSGDVFVWTHAGRPEVIGCILSGPTNQGRRTMFHEFHLLADKPIAPADLQTRRRWQPAEGLAITPVPEAPAPADTPAGRLTQMRQLARDFSAHMQADGSWELRLLPQPLYRYGSEEHPTDESPAIDGALFTYVWTKGTDPELVLLLECRNVKDKPAWHFAPVRFSNRPLQLEYKGHEVWSVASHQEPAQTNSTLYTTAYARTMTLPAPPADKAPHAQPAGTTTPAESKPAN